MLKVKLVVIVQLFVEQVPFIFWIGDVVVCSGRQEHEEHLAQLKRHHLLVLVVEGVAVLPLVEKIPKRRTSGALQRNADSINGSIDQIPLRD